MTAGEDEKGFVCGFCGEVISHDDPEAVRLVLSNLRLGGGLDDPSQEIYAHGTCVGAQLIPGTCFDPEALQPDPIQTSPTSSGHMDRHRQNDWQAIKYDPRFDEYWIPSGDARQVLFHCPFCGNALPDSKRDRWFDELEALGIDPLGADEIPERYRTAAWREG
jgi:predicted RNA-binding Zn-ribbon protein involved in translation (DUF1610 family)